jgi:undecaprenyl diphosphate synthase
MDGNGRWAKARGKSRDQGHIEGAQTFEKIVEYCDKIGVQAITFYAFSTENWKRPKDEVDKIMSLLEKYLDKVAKRTSDYDVRIHFIGEKVGLSEKLLKKMEKIEQLTKEKAKILNIALNYGSRAEIVCAVNKLIAIGKDTVSEEDVSNALYTSESPELDLVIRTAGEQRLSNFLLWQAAYSELYFTDTLWPDMTSDDVDAAIENFYSRKRRFGGLDK